MKFVLCMMMITVLMSIMISQLAQTKRRKKNLEALDGSQNGSVVDDFSVLHDVEVVDKRENLRAWLVDREHDTTSSFSDIP